MHLDFLYPALCLLGLQLASPALAAKPKNAILLSEVSIPYTEKTALHITGPMLTTYPSGTLGPIPHPQCRPQDHTPPRHRDTPAEMHIRQGHVLAAQGRHHALRQPGLRL